MRIKIIVNPVAGGGKAHRYLSEIREILSEKNEIDIRFTEELKEAIPLARQAVKDGYDCVVAGGGDGTLNEVINGVMRENPSVPVGFIPLGITSVFALSVGIPRYPPEACRIINNGTLRKLDLGKIAGQPPTYFASMLGLGFDASVVQKVSSPLKQRLGKAAFILRGLREWFFNSHSARFSVRDDKEETQTGYQAVIGNAPYYGGPFLITPSASLHDGQLDVCVLQRKGRLSLLNFILKAMRNRHLSMKGVTCFRSRRVRVDSDKKIGVQIDGDFWGYVPVEVEVEPQAIGMFLP